MNADWNAYRSFLGVLRTGSLSGAARTLELSQPTVGRHIEALESELGSALFTRSVRGLTPTDAALAIRPHAEAIEAAAEAARRVTSGPDDAITGAVRITTSEIVGGEVLPAMLRDLRIKHAGLAFELSLSNLTEDLMRRDADIAVRMVKPTQGALIALHVGTVGLGLFARKDYLSRAGTPASVAALSQHTSIGYDRGAPALAMMRSRLSLDRAMFALRTDNDLASLAAIRAGFGIGIIQLPLARRSRDLVHVLPKHVRFDLPIWVVMHEDLKRVRRMRVVFDHLAAAMKAYVKA